MATQTRTPIASITLSAPTSEVQFSSIPGDYRDLILVISAVNADASSRDLNFTLNNDSSSVYKAVRGWTAGSGGSGDTTSTNSSGGRLRAISNGQSSFIFQFMDYSRTDKHTNVLGRGGTHTLSTETSMSLTRYPVNANVTSIEIFVAAKQFNFQSGTFSLYGVHG